MKLLAYLFLAFAAYGAFTGMWGAGLLSLLMFSFVLWANRYYTKQDAAWAANPANAQRIAPTTDALRKYDCECMRDIL
jgi:hypothetical protein